MLLPRQDMFQLFKFFFPSHPYGLAPRLSYDTIELPCGGSGGFIILPILLYLYLCIGPLYIHTCVTVDVVKCGVWKPVSSSL